jgi:Trypsin-co-occurring domain 1
MSETIKAYCTSLVKTFQSLASEYAPDNITAEFGLKLSGEGNVYVVKTTGEASLKITAEWKLR